MSDKKVAIIGGGYAGMACAVTLAQKNISTTVYEAGKTLGGRARRIDYHDIALDNGQHILSGAYSELLRLMKMVGAPENNFKRNPLHLRIGPGFEMATPPLPAPLNLAYALLTAKGLRWRDRFAAIQFMQALKRMKFKVDAELTVATLLNEHRQSATLIKFLWESLCVAALNTPIATASAQVFVNVLRDALFGKTGCSDLLLPQTDLSAIFPEPAAVWLTSRKHRVDIGVRANGIDWIEGRYYVQSTAQGAPRNENYDAVVCAIGPHQLADMASDTESIRTVLDGCTAHFSYEPIVTIYLQYVAAVKLALPMIGVSGKTVQWFFDREALSGNKGLIAAVISASGSHEQLDQAQLANLAHEELQFLVGALPSPAWHKVVTEKRATFACTPNLKRPTAKTSVAGFFLAGDYVAGEYPATLEGAVRSGIAAAELCSVYLKN